MTVRTFSGIIIATALFVVASSGSYDEQLLPVTQSIVLSEVQASAMLRAF